MIGAKMTLSTNNNKNDRNHWKKQEVIWKWL